MKLSLKIPVLLCFSLLACRAGSTPASAQATAFEDLRRQHNATRVESSAQLRADANELAGKVVELHGEIAGIVTRDGTRTVLLKMGEDMTVLTSNPETTGNALLRTGFLVRLLARVANDEKNSGYEILVVTDGTASTSAAPAKDDAEIVLPVVATIDTLPPAPGKSTKPIVKKPAAAKTPVDKTTAGIAPAKIEMKKGAAQLPANKPSADEVDEIIESQIPAYAAIVRRHNKKLKPEVVQEISVALLKAGYQNNMDPRFLAAIIAVESDFDVFCLSRSGAMGLGQMMPFNLKEAGVKNPWNPTENVMGTARLLRNLLNSYKDRSNGTLLAVAAYNAGSGAVRRAGYKVPGGSQVQRYVWKVYYRYKQFAPDMF